MHPFNYCAQHELGGTFALLYSGMRAQGSGARSLLAHGITREVKGGVFEALPAGHWFGYAGYEMLQEKEGLPNAAPPPIALPAQWWFAPQSIVSFTQQEDFVQQPHAEDTLAIKELHSNLSTARYLDIVRGTIEQIRAGAFYQANITRKFYGRFERAPDTFALFQKLCAISPSPYSAYLQFGDTAILSSSPEGFLQISDDGKVITRPIKGSAPAGDTALQRSEKDRAENLMITDLMRNDLARSCDQVRVEALYEQHDFATISQLISTITGTRRREQSVLKVIENAFPPGSMTGAPKRAAMHWIAAQERMQRGAYSGALGWLDTIQNTADLSVIIRTLIIQGERFEFQVGGGIIADSSPHKELEETLLKARAICTLLGIKAETLKAL